MSDRAELRRALLADAVEMAQLAGELGYPLAAAEMARRPAALLANERHCVVVAAGSERLLGWLHVEHRSSLEGGDRAELMGLVVDSRARRRGLGRELVAAAEMWAVARGLPALTVRSNAAREQSHPFYESLRYSRSKIQHVYGKVVSFDAAPGTRQTARHENAHLRTARPVADLSRSARLYAQGLCSGAAMALSTSSSRIAGITPSCPHPRRRTCSCSTCLRQRVGKRAATRC